MPNSEQVRIEGTSATRRWVRCRGPRRGRSIRAQRSDPGFAAGSQLSCRRQRKLPLRYSSAQCR